MNNDVFTFLVGGKAGEGVKKTGSVASRLFTNMGRNVFQMDDYQSLIRGGHNFSVVSTSVEEITSHYMKADLSVSFDPRSYEMHKEHLAVNGVMVFNSDAIKDKEGIGIPLTSEAKKYPDPSLRLGVGAIAILSAAIDMSQKETIEIIKSSYPKDTENNITYAKRIYELARPLIGGKFSLNRGDQKGTLLTGNEAIALGAASGGLDIYFAYPMTPSSSILHYLAAHDDELALITVHPENEIAVVNMAIGAAFAGAKVMVGSSGGGFALMEEAFSLAGMTETPLLCVLSSRPGPSTGVPTYTEQADLRFALNQGHGEFPRIVASPGSVEEAFDLTAELLGLVWRFQTPGILLTEKHMSESTMGVNIDSNKSDWAEPLKFEGEEYKRYLDTKNGISPLLFPPSKELIKWNSYECDEKGITSENPEIIAKMHEKRRRKGEALVEYLKKMRTIHEFGEDETIIFTYGSTTMSVLEALKAGDIAAKVVQPKYLEPLPVWELEKFKKDNVIVIEQSCTGLFATLLKEKVGIDAKDVIKKYDGRPFDPIDLAREIKEVM